MNLLEVEIDKTYPISGMCEITPLLEKGVIPGEEVRVIKRQGGLVLFEVIGNGTFVVRDNEAKCIKV